MLGLFKKKKPNDKSVKDEKTEKKITEESLDLNKDTHSNEQQIQSSEKTEDEVVANVSSEELEEASESKGLFQRLKSGLTKTGSSLTTGMNSLVLGQKKIDDDVLEELETRLLMADVGMEATQRILSLIHI